VGAHRDHDGPSIWHRELSCAQCHIVPISVDSAGHIDGDNVAEIGFDGLNPLATYQAETATCANLYCHGNGSTKLGQRVWTDDLTLDCDSCHDDGSGSLRDDDDDDDEGDELSGEHREHIRENIACFQCHAAVVDQSLGFVDPDLHINGVFDVSMADGGAFDPAARRCSDVGCHGPRDW
jgi:predicted CxxxxCH...CXXCH cytochrome family protein